MELYVYRHARMDSSPKGKSDDAGPGLSEAGRRQVETIGPLVNAMGIQHGVVLTSSLRRAKEASEISCRLFWKSSRIVTTDTLLPKAKPEELYKYLNELRSEKQVAVVTHYPLIQKLISDALGYDFKSELPNGSIMRVDFSGAAGRGKGNLVSIVAPRDDAVRANE